MRGGSGGHAAIAPSPGRGPQPGPSGTVGVDAFFDRQPASASSRPPSSTPITAMMIAPRRISSTFSDGSRPTAAHESTLSPRTSSSYVPDFVISNLATDAPVKSPVSYEIDESG